MSQKFHRKHVFRLWEICGLFSESSSCVFISQSSSSRAKAGRVERHRVVCVLTVGTVSELVNLMRKAYLNICYELLLLGKIIFKTRLTCRTNEKKNNSIFNRY